MVKNLRYLTQQAQYIANDELNNNNLSIQGRGTLSKAFADMTVNLRNFAMLAALIADGDLNNKNLYVEKTGVLNDAFQKMIMNLKTGLKAMNQATQEMGNINDSIKVTSQKLDELNDSSRKINDVVDIITGINEKTTLLALNAAIEAARAGKEGRGFAVVADEVNKLAKQTNKSVREISLLVDTIKAKTLMSVESMNNGRNLIANGAKLVEEASRAFSKNNEAINFQYKLTPSLPRKCYNSLCIK